MSGKGIAVRVLRGTGTDVEGRSSFVTKQEFVERVAQKSGLSRRDAAEAVDAFLDSISDALRNGEDVAFTGFGKFSVQNRAARQGVNPRNPSERVQIPASKVPKFSAGSQLKSAVKGS